MLLQDIRGFSIIHKGFNTISRVFSIINKVFDIVNKVVAPRSSLVGTGTLSTGYKVLQGTNPLRKGSKALQVGLGGTNDNLWGHCKSMLASMTISSTDITTSGFHT